MTQPKSEVFLMDCLEGMKQYPDKYFELAIVDPPYGIGVGKMAYTQEPNRLAKQKNGSSLYVKKLGYEHKDWDKSSPDEKYIAELIRVSKNQIVFGINYMDFHLKGGRIVWNKLVPDGISFSDCEIAYCSMQNKVSNVFYMWAGMFQGIYCGTDIKKALVQQGNKQLNEKRIHPTHKPIQLYRWLLTNYAKQGDKILDTHLGSGSSRIAAHQLGFDFTGYEIDKDYFDASEKRFRLVTSQKQIEF